MSSAARRLWALIETFHAVVYFAPEKVAALEGAGLKGGWMGYFASRAAAMGPVGPEVVRATFYNFHPAMVRRALPDAWRYSNPTDVLRARYAVAGGALRRLLRDDLDENEVREAAVLLRDVVAEGDPAGRPLFASHVALDEPADPLVALWHWCTVWREYRGDAHVAALVAEGIGAPDCHLLLAGTSSVPAVILQQFRGWSDDEWTDAARRLQDRGLLDGSGAATDEGRAARARVEATTDERSFDVWAAAGTDAASRFVELMGKPVALIVERGGVVFPNPMGLTESDVASALGRGGADL